MKKRKILKFIIYPIYVLSGTIGGWIILAYIELPLFSKIPFITALEGKVLNPIQLIFFWIIASFIPSFIAIFLIDFQFKKTTLLEKLLLSFCSFGLTYYIGSLLAHSWIGR